MYRRLVFINLLFSEVIKRGQCILKDPISISTFLPINFRHQAGGWGYSTGTGVLSSVTIHFHDNETGTLTLDTTPHLTSPAIFNTVIVDNDNQLLPMQTTSVNHTNSSPGPSYHRLCLIEVVSLNLRSGHGWLPSA